MLRLPGVATDRSLALWAWSDSALYLKRRGDQVALTVEHRSAPTPPRVTFRLVSEPGLAPRLQIVEDAWASGEPLPPLHERVLDALREGTAPMTRASLREKLAVKNDRLGTALLRLERDRIVERTAHGWTLLAPHSASQEDRSLFPPVGGMRGNGTIAVPSDVESPNAQGHSPRPLPGSFEHNVP